MIRSDLNLCTPNNRDLLLRFICHFCEPETCAAMEFGQFAEKIGNPQVAEKVLKELWAEGLISPTNTEIDLEDGALFEVPIPEINDPCGGPLFLTGGIVRFHCE